MLCEPAFGVVGHRMLVGVENAMCACVAKFDEQRGTANNDFEFIGRDRDRSDASLRFQRGVVQSCLAMAQE